MRRNQSQNFRISKVVTERTLPKQSLVQSVNSLGTSLTCKSFTPRQRTLKPLVLKHNEIKTEIISTPVVQEEPKKARIVLQKQTSINLKRGSILSVLTTQSNESQDDEDYEIWDNNQDLRVKKMTLDDTKPSIGQFLQLYKARYGGFPGQKKSIKNEDVIQAAVHHAAADKKLFRKYFPKKQIVFEDENDYSKPYKVEEDQHFQSFNNFFKTKKTFSTIKLHTDSNV